LKETKAFALFLILASGILLPLFSVPKANAASPNVYLSVNPSMYTGQTDGETFLFNIDVTNVANMSSYKFTVTYNSSLLKTLQVFQNSFFPSSLSHFNYQIDALMATIKINCSMNNPAVSITGSGTLASVAFEVISNPSPSADGPVALTQTSLVNSKGMPISHDAIGAVYFWRALEPDPPTEGRILDIFTQRGGVGLGQPDGNYTTQEEVQLISNVTYNGYPVQQKLVAFQVQNPLGDTVVLRTAITDSNGQASISFRIPNQESSIGTWQVMSVVEIAEGIAWDIVTFEVRSPVPVGGYSISRTGDSRADAWVPYQIALMTLGVFLITGKLGRRKTKT
jgi:Cohesin domain